MKIKIEEDNSDMEEINELLRINTKKILSLVSECSLSDFKQVQKFLRFNEIDFHQKKIDNISLVQHIINRELMKEREDLIDLIRMIKMKRNGNKELEKQVIKSLKTGTKTSPGLATFLKSASSRFAWGSK